MTEAQKQTRQRKSQLLEVRQQDPTTYLVQSQSDPSFYYKVVLNGSQTCHCQDYKLHADPETGWTCKHIAAALDLRSQVERVEAIEAQAPSAPAPEASAPSIPVPMRDMSPAAARRMHNEMARIAQEKQPIGFTAPLQLSEKERINLECQAMFGDMEAAAILNGKPARAPKMEAVPAIELPRTVEMPSAAEEIPQKEICSECGAPIDPEAMKNFNSKGLICGGCLRKAQMEALNPPVEEPPDPCMGCGQLLPASELLPWTGADGSGLICQECHGELDPTAEEMETLEAPQAPYSWTPEQLAECRKETEQLRAEAAEIRAANETFRQRWETSQSKAATAVPSLAERIDQVNEILSSFGAVAIESDQKGFTGYGAQYVLDAVNAAMGPDGWKYDLVSHSVEKVGDKSTRAMVMIQLSLKQDNGSWFCHGPQFGGGQSSDPADALKSALTDALKKALSHWGIGSKAYRGELKASRSDKAA